MKVPRPAPHARGEVVEALEAIADEVDDLVGAIDAAVAGGGDGIGSWPVQALLS